MPVYDEALVRFEKNYGISLNPKGLFVTLSRALCPDDSTEPHCFQVIEDIYAAGTPGFSRNKKQPPAVQALIEAAKDALQALKSESAQWKGEGYQGDYSDDEIEKLEKALKPFFE